MGEVSMVRNHFYSNLDRCELNKAEIHMGRHRFSSHVVDNAKGLTCQLAAWPYVVKFPGPRVCNSTDLCDPCLLPCVSTLSCPLLGNTDQPRPRRTCTECQ